MNKLLVPLAALAIAAGGIVGGSAVVSSFAEPSPVQSKSEAWLPQPQYQCGWVQVGWWDKVWMCWRRP